MSETDTCTKCGKTFGSSWGDCNAQCWDCRNEPTQTPHMSEKEANRVLECIECEGFEYTFTGYSGFNDIDDTEFHKLRKDFLQSINKLESYIIKYAGRERCDM